MSKRESINQEPLTIEELKTMAGLPVWCPEEESYGIVMCDKMGRNPILAWSLVQRR